jgi:hypothetical protein
MKTYIIEPEIDLIDPKDIQVVTCLKLISEVVFDHLRYGGDHFHYTVDWRNPEDTALNGYWNSEVAQPHIVSLTDANELMKVIRLSLNPWDRTWAIIRSVATCRMATFGYDGQAFLCLREADKAPMSPNPFLVNIESVDPGGVFDGWLHIDEN